MGMTEREKMLAGELYSAQDGELREMYYAAQRRCRLYNATTEEELGRREELLKEIFGALGEGAEIVPPFHCDYGVHIRAGDGLYMNFGCVVLDCAAVEIGDRVLLGPKVQIYAALHPVEPEVRRTGLEGSRAVRIGSDVWIGGGSIVCPGVTIGDGVTIGAGSVVTRDVPAGVVAAGNPCRVLRKLAEAV